MAESIEFEGSSVNHLLGGLRVACPTHFDLRSSYLYLFEIVTGEVYGDRCDVLFKAM